MFPLQNLRSGESGCIVDVDGQRDLVQRLSELGLRTGVTVKLLRSGSPLLIALDGHRMTLRPDDRVTILVEPLVSLPQ